MSNPATGVSTDTRLADFIRQYKSLFVLTGAGCSTASGIPDYRDERGEWKHRKPVQYLDFRDNEPTRKRYWARSLAGWPSINNAQPAATHLALSTLEQAGLIRYLVTQNVDGLHQKAGSTRVLDLHGKLETVSCLDCRQQLPRAYLQEQLLQANPSFVTQARLPAPDGDSMGNDPGLSSFNIIDCPRCDGVLKPDVVFFGESVPADRVNTAMQHLHAADAMLVIGSSLMVYSAYRFCNAAVTGNKPMCAVNRGSTRADNVLSVKIEADCGNTLLAALEQLGL